MAADPSTTPVQSTMNNKPVPTSRPDPYTDPVGFLKFNGWRPLGFENHPSTLWEDPTKPTEDQWTQEPIMITVEKNKEGGRPGEKEWEVRQLVMHNGIPKHLGGSDTPKFRSVCTPAGEPMPLSEAIKVCLHLERVAHKAERAKQAKQAKKAGAAA